MPKIKTHSGLKKVLTKRKNQVVFIILVISQLVLIDLVERVLLLISLIIRELRT